MSTVAIGIVCKTPVAGASKTRLSPPLTLDECAALSACFIRDVAATVQSLVDDGDVTGYAVFTPAGTEAALRELLPQSFDLVLQCDGDLGARMHEAVASLLEAGHAGVVLVGSDLPTLPKSILRQAVDAVCQGDCVALCPALDGGYPVIGLSRQHSVLFEGMPWSTAEVYRLTLERARGLGLPVVTLPGWYDVDDEASLQMLVDEVSGRRPGFAAPDLIGAEAPATRQFLGLRQRGLAERLATPRRKP